MLGVGIDWAGEFHLVARVGPMRVIEVPRVDNAPAAVAALIGRILQLEADPVQVQVLEARHGLLVETLRGCGVHRAPGQP